ncbi:RNA-guided endonuclease InsQ/TnpB family protein [Streptomyces bambusae]|uniref:IS200/IS605 family element transposase accessory protein TnpB n=1 Tax=Streptomyces bambusae TaxID=1550616 RepID=A0ABS6Z0D9_9ACTN|nr:RNA-guided endonuclease TnpB family protein [Streptomyces bambusae]MBW5481198.1 IS200/IS605 family element transposase accessory protein TnpB [Streptomyces bambusae]
MKIVVQVKLLPASAHDADALAATLRACNRAANAASEVAFTRDLKRRNVLQEAVYHRIKADFDLGAQPAVRVVKKVCDAYATLKANIKAGNLGREGAKRRVRAESKPVVFREDSAQPYDDRILTWNLDARTVSIWTVAGRLKGIPFVCSPQALKLLASRKGESDLVMRDGMFFLVATIDIPEPPLSEPTGFLGVDLGIVNIATTSDGEVLAGRGLNRYRKRDRDLRAKLQKKRTKSAKRVLKRIRRREARHAANTNHIIAKRIVATAERTSRGIGLEDLSGIRQRVTARKDQRARLHSWAFAQLGAFIAYKAQRAGVPVVHVDPRNTSRQCSECWHTHRTNRVDQARFVCRSCGTVMHADHNGSRNIAHRADAVWKRGAVNRPRTSAS